MIGAMLSSSPSFAQQKPLPGKQSITIVIPASANARIKFGADKLSKALKDAGYKAKIISSNKASTRNRVIVIGSAQDALVKNANNLYHLTSGKVVGKEGFNISSSKDDIVISGTDNSGALYGCIELATR